MRVTRLFVRGLSAAVLGAATACHDGTAAPRADDGQQATPFDAARARATIAPLTAVFDQSIFKSFDGAHPFLDPLLHSVAPGAKGKTYVYDPATKLYVEDSNATGAPASGSRFVLYSWQEDAGRPVLPLVRIGYVDIAPVGPATAPPELVEVVVVRDSPRAVIAEFITVHGTNAGNNNTFTINGSANDGTTTVDVNLSGTESGGAGAHQLVFNSSLAALPLGLRSDERLTFDQATASQGGNVGLTYGGHTLLVEVVDSGNNVTFDGTLYARIIVSKTLGETTRYLKPDGTPLAQKEIDDLNALIEGVVVAHFFWIDLAWP